MEKKIPDKLYKRILQVIPIACVDLLVINPKNEILLLKRKNQPSKGQWWFPGGRVHFMETRKHAATRKLKEECGSAGNILEEIGTYEVILHKKSSHPSHGITTVYKMQLKNSKVVLDNQSTSFSWKPCSQWLKEVKSSFVKMILQKYNYDHFSK